MRASFSTLRLRFCCTDTLLRRNDDEISRSCPLWLYVEVLAGRSDLRGFRGHTRIDLGFGGELANFAGQLHRAELRSAHRAEVRELGAVGRQRLVVELLCRVGVERKME